jgi:hypothetical protein
VRLLGIALSHFEGPPPASAQLGFFEAEGALTAKAGVSGPEPVEGVRDRALTQAVDRIRNRFGSTAILPARLVRGPVADPPPLPGTPRDA